MNAHDADALRTRMGDLADQLMAWLDEQLPSDAVSVFFLCGIVGALVEARWPDEHEQRPQTLVDLIVAIETLGAELGPVIVHGPPGPLPRMTALPPAAHHDRN